MANGLALLRWQRHEKPWERFIEEQGSLPVDDCRPGKPHQQCRSNPSGAHCPKYICGHFVDSLGVLLNAEPSACRARQCDLLTGQHCADLVRVSVSSTYTLASSAHHLPAVMCKTHVVRSVSPDEPSGFARADGDWPGSKDTSLRKPRTAAAAAEQPGALASGGVTGKTTDAAPRKPLPSLQALEALRCAARETHARTPVQLSWVIFFYTANGPWPQWWVRHSTWPILYLC